jgi:enediyne core biosynthesis thioesterase
MKSYEYRHVVAFEETNLVGNVYYTNHIRWQGRCREMFLKDHAPDIVNELSKGLALITTRVSCDYFGEIAAFDEIIVKMRLAGRTLNRITMSFEYWRQSASSREQLVARGEQEIACTRRIGEELVAIPPPQSLADALSIYADDATVT